MTQAFPDSPIAHTGGYAGGQKVAGQLLDFEKAYQQRQQTLDPVKSFNASNPALRAYTQPETKILSFPSGEEIKK